jgi:hypothetical protein
MASVSGIAAAIARSLLKFGAHSAGPTAGYRHNRAFCKAGSLDVWIAEID